MGPSELTRAGGSHFPGCGSKGMAGISGLAGPLGASGEPLNTGGGGMTQESRESSHREQGWMVGPRGEIGAHETFFVGSIEFSAQEPCIYLSTLLVLHFTWPYFTCPCPWTRAKLRTTNHWVSRLNE